MNIPKMLSYEELCVGHDETYLLLKTLECVIQTQLYYENIKREKFSGMDEKEILEELIKRHPFFKDTSEESIRSVVKYLYSSEMLQLRSVSPFVKYYINPLPNKGQ